MTPIEKIRSSRPVDIYRNHRSPMTEAEFRRRCGGQPIWHSIDLGDVFIEGVGKDSTRLALETQLLDWPDLRGKTVLDIGAFGGWFSFEAERRGAASVTAVDYYSWAPDWRKLLEWLNAERAAGRVPDAYSPPAHILDEVGQPGRLVFDLTREALGSKVKSVLATMESFNSDPFDVVLYLGVLYHQENPLASLRKVFELTKDCLILETLGVHVPDQETRPVWEFYCDNRINNDFTTWWAPNECGLIDMLRAVGFKHIELKSGASRLPAEHRKKMTNIRIWVHAWK